MVKLVQVPDTEPDEGAVEAIGADPPTLDGEAPEEATTGDDEPTPAEVAAAEADRVLGVEGDVAAAQRKLAAKKAPAKKTAAKAGLIGQPLSDQDDTLSCLLYGPEGTGKTTSGLGMAKLGRVILLDAEGGAKKQALKRQGVNVDNVEIWPTAEQGGPGHITWATIENELFVPMKEALAEDPNSIIGLLIDSFSELSRRLLDEVVGDAKKKAAQLGKQRDQFYVGIEDYGVQSQMMRTLLRRFRDLGINLVITALERRDVDSDGTVVYGPAVGPSISSDTRGLVDIVCYTYTQQIGTETFYIGQTGPGNLRKAKDRLGVLPGLMVNPSSDRMIAYVSGDLERADDPHQQRIKAAIAQTTAPAPVEPTVPVEGS